MIIKILVENTSISKAFNSEHGLSLYIETDKHKLLFDLGASGLFAENAEKMNVDLSQVDLVIISHGHYDHGGGLKAFLNINTKAKIYLHQKAFQRYYSNRLEGEKKYIGLEEGLLPSDRFIFTGNYLCIDKELELFSNVKGKKLTSLGNQQLLTTQGDTFIQDDFSHEQNLMIHENDKTVLVAGCAHKGIVNILDHVIAAKGSAPHYVIGGFHLYNRPANKYEDPLLICQIGEYLKDTGAKYYTCHCTGIEPYKKLREIMGEKIQYLATGSQRII